MFLATLDSICGSRYLPGSFPPIWFDRETGPVLQKPPRKKPTLPQPGGNEEIQ